MPVVQIQPPKQDSLGAQNDRNREQQFALLQQIAPKPPGSPFPNVGVLGSGSYRGAMLTGVVDVSGVNDPQVIGQVTFDGNGIVSGVDFREAVNVSATATVAFVRCRFNKAVNVASGGKVAATGCRFDGTSAILNAGGPLNASSNGCVKTSAVAHANTTILGEV